MWCNHWIIHITNTTFPAPNHSPPCNIVLGIYLFLNIGEKKPSNAFARIHRYTRYILVNGSSLFIYGILFLFSNVGHFRNSRLNTSPKTTAIPVQFQLKPLSTRLLWIMRRSVQKYCVLYPYLSDLQRICVNSYIGVRGTGPGGGLQSPSHSVYCPFFGQNILSFWTQTSDYILYFIWHQSWWELVSLHVP